jgi:sulfatase maturation enzyme AslB (radical SAM superfamily)
MFPQQPETASAPGLGLDLALTARCPLRCRFCSVSRAPVPELSAREWRRVLSDFARQRPIGLVSLEGGEPLTRRDLPEILAAGIEFAAEVKVVTSGVLPLAALPVELVRHPAFTLEVSVDGPPAVHDFLRDGSWRAAWRCIHRALEQGVRLRLRSVLSAVNRDCLEAWLADVDRELAGGGAPVGYRFDVLILPETLQRFGGPRERHGLRTFDGRGQVPSPADILALYERLRERRFRRLRLEQSEPIRGCGAGRQPSVSFDPAGMFSFCCEVPRGFGSIREVPAAECLALLDERRRCLPCRRCIHLREARCDGCWTGQKCGLVGYWQAVDCAALLHSADARGRVSN